MTVNSIITAMRALDQAYGLMGYECSASVDGCVYSHYAMRLNQNYREWIVHTFEISADNVSVDTYEERL